MKEKFALITNVCDYAGYPAVAALIAAGFTVLAHDLSFAKEEGRKSFEKQYPEAKALPQQEPEEVIGAVRARTTALAVLVSNDSFPAIHLPIAAGEVADLRQTLERLVVFPYQLLRAAIPLLIEGPGARVVMITSCRTELPMVGGAIPDMARAANNALVTSLSLELAPYQVPVNAIAPNFLYSEAYFPKAKFVESPAGRTYIQEVVPIGRMGEPEEVAELITYLATMKGSFQTGSIIKFSGGWPSAVKRPA